MIISVVVCTYNGEKFIYDQLKSIADQTLKPDEVIIQDDKSKDSTVEIVNNIIVNCKLDNTWRILENEVNLGWKRNFINAIAEAKGDIIFFADQDDIWHKDKLEKMIKIIKANSSIEVLFSQLSAFDSDTGNPVDIYQPIYGSAGVTKVNPTKYFAECGRQGCTYAIRKTFAHKYSYLWQEDWPHDQFFWCLSLFRGTLYSYNETLIDYRRHEFTNTPDNEKSVFIRTDLLERCAHIGEMLISHQSELGIDDQYMTLLQRGIMVYYQRSKSIKSKNIFKTLSLIRYISYYPRPKAWLGDVLAGLN